MKKWILSVVALSGILLAVSCTKQYNQQPIGNSSSTGGSGTGTGAGSTNWNWSGTPPLSAKVNGVPFATDASSLEIMELTGYYHIIVFDASGNAIGVSVATNATPGKEYSIPSPYNVSYTYADAGGVVGGVSGKYKILTNNATTIEGLFWANTKDYTNGLQNPTPAPVVLTEGYFKVTKP